MDAGHGESSRLLNSFAFHDPSVGVPDGSEFCLEAADFHEEICGTGEGFDTERKCLVFLEIHQGVAGPGPVRLVVATAGLECERLGRN